MSRYNKFGFYKNKYSVGQLSGYTNTYPKYPSLPDSTKFFEFMRGGFTRNSAPVANVDVVSIAPLNNRNTLIYNNGFLLPDGNVAFHSYGAPIGGNTTISKYNAETNSFSIVSTSFPVSGDLYKSGTMCRDSKFRLYIGDQSSLKYNRVLEVNTTTLAITEKSVPAYDSTSKQINLYSPTQLDYTLWHKNLLAPKLTNNFSNINIGYFWIHDLNANTFTRTSAVYDGRTSVQLPQADNVNMVQHPVNGNVYIIPGEGFVRNGERSSGINPNGYDPRVIVEYNPFTDTTRRFTPNGANLSVNNPTQIGQLNAYTESLFGSTALGVDGNIYCFPGVCRTDILAFNPVSNTSVQGTFNIFSNTGSNTIVTYGAITAPDGYIYAKARGVQTARFSGEQDFWLAIDTNPTSATYRQGTCIPVDPLGINTNLGSGKQTSIVMSKNGLIMGQPNTTEFMATLQTYGNGGYFVSHHPSLNMNSCVIN
jgi:hypothetical protein